MPPPKLTLPPDAGICLYGLLGEHKDGDTSVVDVIRRYTIRHKNNFVPDKNKMVNDRALGYLNQICPPGTPVLLHMPFSALNVDQHSFERIIGEIWKVDMQRWSLGELQVRAGNASSTKEGKLGE